ncbi:hypothetical protein V495_08767 [Pseudogymnoascus sp. VKM F-4514 (FW-929)]|nr:hypothetical protein V490_02093 [Pseudogymnoascus sp. VKM F-3557]KFY32759.1 hypothetical protein V495_08767 [Pseudogymnoascus sp. VKM F-4514 (FW-929)]KFY58207.1 hypothetical protein V497_04974 [Pseudogymnoascus sp. VKM F-4516 (FW-969)]
MATSPDPLSAGSIIRPQLSSIVSNIVLGGGSFSQQSHPDPTRLPVREIIQLALDNGIRTFDTSPYYGPSEILLGDAFSQLAISSKYKRGEYQLMTKVGRVTSDQFNYSRSWIRDSVDRSLQRLKTSYLDVVFCHDIEYVTEEEAVGAVGFLLELVEEGKIRYVGISGYPIDKLVRVAQLVREQYMRPLDAVQGWGQLTLQNTRMEHEGLPNLYAAGVNCIFNSSPLCIGLLRSGGVPVGTLGDWHPAPQGLRQAVLQASNWLEDRQETLPAVALRFCISRLLIATKSQGASMVFAASSVSELEVNLQTLTSIMQDTTGGTSHFRDIRHLRAINKTQLKRDMPLFDGVRGILGPWIDYTFEIPEK